MRSRSLSTSVVILWNLSQPALWWTIPAIEAIESREPTVKRFKAMQVKDGIRRTSLSLLLNSAVKWPTSFIIYGQTPEIGNFTLTAGCSQRVVVVVGGGGGIDHVSWKIKWPFHISRTINSAFHVSREKKFLYDQSCLFWLRTTAKELPCSMSPPFSRFLFLVLWKGNRVLCLEVEAPHHLLIQKNCHPRGRYGIESWSALEIPDEDPSFLSSSCGTSMSQFTMNSTLETRFTDYCYQKSRLTTIINSIHG